MVVLALFGDAASVANDNIVMSIIQLDRLAYFEP